MMTVDIDSKTRSGSSSGTRMWRTQGLFGLLVLVSIVGVAVTDFSTLHGFWYWLAVAPVFALVSLSVSLSHIRRQGQSAAVIVGKQILHWLAMALIILLIYMLQTTGRMNNADAGLVGLLVLALTTFLAGVHFDWRLGVLGLVLGATAVGAAFLEEYLWVVVLTAVGAGAIVLFWKRRAT